jgi:uncharacterized protein involved in exopolysaccharide biosynthesis/Mrp family chromosome partitioning ATPase
VANKVAVPIVQDTADQEFVENLPTEIEILQSPTLLNKAMNKLEPAYRGIPVWQIQSQLTLRQPKDTNVLSVSYQDTDATRAKAILDATVAAYIAYSEESRRSPVTNAIRFIEMRLPKAQQALRESSSALTEFRTQYNLDNPDSNVSLAYSAKVQIEQGIAAAAIELNQREQQYGELRSQIAQLGQDPNTAISDAVLNQDLSQNITYQSIKKQLADLEVEYQLGQTRFTPNHPAMQELKERRDELKGLLQAETLKVSRGQKRRDALQTTELGAIRQSLAERLWQTDLERSAQKKRLSDLRQQSVQANLMMQQMLRLQQEYKELERQYRFNAETVDGFLAKLQELRIQEAQDTFTWKVLESPNLPTVPQARSRTRGLVLGFLTSVLGGIGVAFFLEKIDSRLKDLEEIKKATQLPILGVLPQSQTAISAGLASDSFTEAIRSVALGLSFGNTQATGKVIAVTSATKGEGKTTIAYNLGLALAELEKRVLIVDANLVQPTLHQVFSLPNSQGLTTAIATAKPWQAIIHSTNGEPAANEFENREKLPQLPEIMAIASKNGSHNGTSAVFARVSTANLLLATALPPERPVEQYPDILTSGPVATNSFSWLVSEKMQQLLGQWRQSYDYILLDTSALMELADAQSLTSQSDEVIFVISLKRVERAIVTDALEILQRNDTQIAGVVVNTAGQGKGGNSGQGDNPFA